MGSAHPPESWPWVMRPAQAAPIEQILPGLAAFSGLAQMPFDVLRAQHARAVQVGLLPRSLLESSSFDHTVDALEHVTLGPFARHV